METIDWLLASSEPAIRAAVRRDLLRVPADDDEAQILSGPIVRGLFDGQTASGGFGGHPYMKWTGAHWRLVALVELGIPAGEQRAVRAVETVLDWLTGTSHRRNVPVVAGLPRRCGSQEGNALAVATRLGMATDERTELLARSLIEWQWPDGGWNCDRREAAHRSSFHETLQPVWGLHEWASATGDRDAAAAARRGAELFLEHRLYRSLATGETINDEWLTPHWPPYWHYDVLQALIVLHRMGVADDPRADDARAAVHSRRRSDGHWHASLRWWRPPGSSRAPEAVDWRADEAADRMVTLRCLTVLGSAGELDELRPAAVSAAR